MSGVKEDKKYKMFFFHLYLKKSILALDLLLKKDIENCEEKL